MPNVQTPDGKVIQFPDTMPEQEINAILDKEYGATNQPQSESQPWWVNPAKTMIETGGMVAGGTLGTAAGPLGTVAGAGLGYAGAKQASDRLLELLGVKKQEPVGETFKKAGTDVLTGAAMEMGGQAVGPFISTLTGAAKNTNKFIDTLIDKAIEKGIRPTVVGKATHGQAVKYMDNAREAVKTIVKNKDTLLLTDDIGNVMSGELPKNLKQFGEAIEQMKTKIFSEYDALATQAAGPVMGVHAPTGLQYVAQYSVDLKPIANELQTISRNKVVNDLSPEIAKYAEGQAERFLSRGLYTAKEAQEAIAHLNDGLKAFYARPSYENATKASIDAMIVNRLRRYLDDMIESAVGPGYQVLKKQYGALKTIEKDVIHRATIDARKNNKGLIDFSDIYSGSEVIRGVLSMSPARVGGAVTAKIIAATYKHWNNPNTIINKMFGNVDKLLKTQGQHGVSEETGKMVGRLAGYELTNQLLP